MTRVRAWVVLLDTGDKSLGLSFKLCMLNETPECYLISYDRVCACCQSVVKRLRASDLFGTGCCC